MDIALPKEIKDNEYRVGLVPAGVHTLKEEGHRVWVEKGAGVGSGFSDDEYLAAGARLLDSPEEVFERGELLVKVKEPVLEEAGRLKAGQMLASFLHLAPLPELTRALLERRVTGIAYETIRDRHGHLPLLTPMSEVAGRMSITVGCHFLQKTQGGRGILLAGVPGVRPGSVLILGGGTVGTNAAKMAMGLGANVRIMDSDVERLKEIDDLFFGRVETVVSNAYTLAELIREADLVIGAVLLRGANTPKLITRNMVSSMQRGAVIVDVAVDQGGCCETSRPTTHSNPVFEVDGVLHYCVTNMPGAIPRTSTLALTNSTLPYIQRLAGSGLKKAVADDPHLKDGVNVYRGKITLEAVAQSQGLTGCDLSELL